jgi:hypothetical protein
LYASGNCKESDMAWTVINRLLAAAFAPLCHSSSVSRSRPKANTTIARPPMVSARRTGRLTYF